MKLFLTIYLLSRHFGHELGKTSKIQHRNLEIMQKLAIFAAETIKENTNMCAISLELDNALMDKIRPSFPSQEMLSKWMQAQVESLVRKFIAQEEVSVTRCRYSDEDLEQLFAGRPCFDESVISDSSKEDFRTMVRSHAHKPSKGIEKWL